MFSNRTYSANVWDKDPNIMEGSVKTSWQLVMVFSKNWCEIFKTLHQSCKILHMMAGRVPWLHSFVSHDLQNCPKDSQSSKLFVFEGTALYDCAWNLAFPEVL